MLGHDDARRAGGGNHDQVKQRINRVGGTLGQRYGGGIAGVAGFDSRVVADLDLGVQSQAAGLQLLINDVGGQHLGHTGRHTGDVGVILVKRFPSLRVHDENAFRLVAERGSAGREAAEQHQDGQNGCDQFFSHTVYPP